MRQDIQASSRVSGYKPERAFLVITSHRKTHLLTSALPTLDLCTFHWDTLENVLDRQVLPSAQAFNVDSDESCPKGQLSSRLASSDQRGQFQTAKMV